MPPVTRHIGLSLGADICWPICFEDILNDLKLSIPIGKQVVELAVERVSIEPFDLRQKIKYSLVIDRLTHWYHTSREWIKKGVLMDDLYVFNNPWSVQANEKHTSYCAMMALGLPVPDTFLVPPKAYEPKADLDFTLQNYARMFDLGEWGRRFGYPLFMKPFDGGGWQGVSKLDDEAQLRQAYEQSGKLIMHVQKAVHPYDMFVRAVGLGPQVRLMQYDPGAPLHGRYMTTRNFVDAEDQRVLEDMVLTINSYFGWDFNSCESLRKDDVWHPIDFANPCPDSQVNSIHYHFPWYVKANLKWAVFVVATQRAMRKNLDFEPFHQIARQDLPYLAKLKLYGKLARERFEQDRFESFCQQHLAHLDEVAFRYFASDRAHAAVRKKVAHIYPPHEVEAFTERFWQQLQQWREVEGQPSGGGA
jgi:hypothetical protein